MLYCCECNKSWSSAKSRGYKRHDKKHTICNDFITKDIEEKKGWKSTDPIREYILNKPIMQDFSKQIPKTSWLLDNDLIWVFPENIVLFNYNNSRYNKSRKFSLDNWWYEDLEFMRLYCGYKTYDNNIIYFPIQKKFVKFSKDWKVLQLSENLNQMN